jgi:hypothetical protein
MEFVPDFKKGGSGLRYIREMNDFHANESSSVNSVLYFQSTGINKTSGEFQMMILKLDISPLLMANNQTHLEGPPLLVPV